MIKSTFAPKGMNAVAPLDEQNSCIGCDLFEGDICVDGIVPDCSCIAEGRPDKENVIFQMPRTTDSDCDRMAKQLFDLGFTAKQIAPKPKRRLEILEAEADRAERIAEGKERVARAKAARAEAEARARGKYKK